MRRRSSVIAVALVAAVQVGCPPPGTDGGVDSGPDANPPGTDANVVLCDCTSMTARDDTYDAGVVSFATELQPVLVSSCASDAFCHLIGAGGLSFNAGNVYTSIVDVPATGTAFTSMLDLVEPGLPNDSYLFHKLAGSHLTVAGMGCRMPMVGECRSPEFLQIMWVWIEQGAPDN